MNKEQKHLYHLVDASPWPLVTSGGVLGMLVSFVAYMHRYFFGFALFLQGFVCVLFGAFIWWRDIIREGVYEGAHTQVVERGLRYGMAFFILSEVMFFFSFFWAFFYSSVSPTIEIGAVWPPVGVVPFDPYEVPLLNTIVLLTSGAMLTWAHHGLVEGKYKEAFWGMVLTIEFAIFFTCWQAFEYSSSDFYISDSVFGGTFFIATGFHGFHVIIGTIFIFVCLVRLWLRQFTVEHHFGFIASAWYWHFVDVVWLFLFCVVYVWPAMSV